MNREKPAYVAEEAARLSAIYTARKADDKSLSQLRVAHECGWSTQSAVSQYLRGTIPLNLEALIKLSKALQFSPAEVSPRLAENLAIAQQQMTSEGEDNPTGTKDDRSAPHQDDYALIPQYTAKGSSGSGYLNEHVEVNGTLAFKRAWLARMSLKPETLKVIYNHGQSNWPTLDDGEVLLIDESQTEPRNGKMFAILDQDSETIVKRLIRELTGTWLIRSDNPDKARYPDLPITEEGLRSIQIIGRVVWRGGAI
ncbi:S24 family peptidase [Pseudomonas sp. LFM046]|uniref:LexA family transcriptional regulator n=1 Tax=Pseudomonas sp. LFM046 TaxID=1608357 RepID=UPI0006979CDA|nr:S24 family peptidase [Pseudomonas sp. LFM046]